MAASIITWEARSALYPATDPAQAGFTQGTNFPFMTLNYDQTTAEKVYFIGVIPQSYTGGDISVKVFWTATTTGNVVWGVKYLRRIDDDVLDAALSSQATVTDGVTAANDLMVASISIASPTIAAGALLLVEMARVAGDAADTLAADAKLLAVEIQE